LGIHLYFPDPPADFDQRVLLYKDSTYLLNRWWVIIHCLLVIISMWGVAVVQMKKSPGFTGLGFLLMAVFGIAEITRQLFVLFYVNELRGQYDVAIDPTTKEILRNNLTNAVFLTVPLFALFVLSFAFGNLFYGLSLYPGKGFTRNLSILLIIWAVGTFLAFGNSIWRVGGINKFIEHYNYIYQPLVRGLLAVWLWKEASKRYASPPKTQR
jgi:hypothetical protein